MPSGRDNKHRSRAAAPGFATVAVAVVAALGLSAQPADAAIIPGPVSATVTVPKSHGVTGATALRVAPAPQPARAANFVARSVRWPNAATASVATGPSATFIRAGSTPVSVRRSGGTTTHTQVRVAYLGHHRGPGRARDGVRPGVRDRRGDPGPGRLRGPSRRPRAATTPRG